MDDLSAELVHLLHILSISLQSPQFLALETELLQSMAGLWICCHDVIWHLRMVLAHFY